MTAFTGIKNWILDLMFPKFCVGCRSEGTFLCAACRAGLPSPAPSCPVCSRRNFTGILCDPCAEKTNLRRFLAPFPYSHPLVRELIHTYKYTGVRELAPLLADEISSYLHRYAIRPAEPACLIPIPLHRRRERERGFDQARLLARALSERLSLPIAAAVIRSRSTEQQARLDSHDARRRNVADAFRVIAPEAISGRTAILVDDVSTSGATLTEAARVLREAGARTVWAIVIAKG